MAVRHLQVDSPPLRHTSSLGKYIVRLYSDTDDFDTLRQQTQYNSRLKFHDVPVLYITHCCYTFDSAYSIFAKTTSCSSNMVWTVVLNAQYRYAIGLAVLLAICSTADQTFVVRINGWSIHRIFIDYMRKDFEKRNILTRQWKTSWKMRTTEHDDEEHLCDNDAPDW